MVYLYNKRANPTTLVGKNESFYRPQPRLVQGKSQNEREINGEANKATLRTNSQRVQRPFFSPVLQPQLATKYPVEGWETRSNDMEEDMMSKEATLIAFQHPAGDVYGPKNNSLLKKLPEVVRPAPASLIQKQDGEPASSAPNEPPNEAETTDSASEDIPNVTIELPLPLTIRVNGVMFTAPTFLLEGPNGRVLDLAPYTGSGFLDFPLAALESLGIPVLSFYHFHYGRARQYLGRHFENAYALSGGTSFIRNALHYGYITADDVTLFGAPSSFHLEHYGGIPHLNIVANPMDIGTMINVSYFNYPMFERHNNPAVMFSVTAPFDQNPFEAFTNLGGAIYHALRGDLYNQPGVTHSYPRFQSGPTEAIGSPHTTTRVSP
jgi:hypothetical protein